MKELGWSIFAVQFKEDDYSVGFYTSTYNGFYAAELYMNRRML
jgi:hypothetical protein